MGSGVDRISGARPGHRPERRLRRMVLPGARGRGYCSQAQSLHDPLQRPPCHSFRIRPTPIGCCRSFRSHSDSSHWCSRRSLPLGRSARSRSLHWSLRSLAATSWGRTAPDWRRHVGTTGALPRYVAAGRFSFGVAEAPSNTTNLGNGSRRTPSGPPPQTRRVLRRKTRSDLSRPSLSGT